MSKNSNIDAIFCSAIEIESPEERKSYVQQICGDDNQLRSQLLRLLNAHFLGGSILDSPANSFVAALDQTISEKPGVTIGPYKLLDQIGEGGFGVVFLAEQERPVRRKVALKVIKPGMDTHQVIARFEAERQALAMMDHPNIAKVYEAGATENGRPYFVMELVQGVPITEYCDQCNLTTRERLELFILVCQAVQHAHQKGVIHRDIKPTNVLVAMQDGRPAPKVIDFGVAKAIDQRLTEHTLTTAFAQMLGSPLYMSPEQAELSPLGVDTRSDIYSLGVMLYELLSGTTPFDKDRLHSASYDELRRIIREEEPPRPSARISTLAADLATTIAEHRRTDTRRLGQTVRGELDWIVMKCLEKDRSRRYETPNSLARDIERNLHDEPVQACPPSASYRFRKFARRNKTLLAAGGAIAAALVVGLGLANWQYIRATTESVRAQAVSKLLQEMLASSNPDQVKGSKYTVRELLDDFSAGLGDQLAGEPEVEAAIRSVIGKSYWRLGVYDRAELHSKKALDLRRQLFGPDDERVADSLIDYAWSLSEQGRDKEAEQYVRDALTIYGKQNSGPGATIRALWSLQEFLMRQRRLAEAEQVALDAMKLAGDGKDSDYTELPNILHGLANAKLYERKYAEAEKWAQQAVEMHRRVHGDHHIETAWGLTFLGEALSGQQKLMEAESALRESWAIFCDYYTPEHDSIRRVSKALTSVLEAKGDRAGLDALARRVAEQENENRSNSPGYHLRLAKLLLANKSPTDAQKEEAQQSLRRAIEGFNRMVILSWHNLQTRQTVWEGYIEVARVCAATPGFSGEVDEMNRLLKAEFSEVLANITDPNRSANVFSFIAVAQLRLGDKTGYRATCKALVALPFVKLDGRTKSRAIWTPCLGPDALDDPSLPERLGQKFVANNSLGEPQFGTYILGAAHYRAGHFDQAVQRFEESIAAFLSGAAPATDSINYPRLLLAMTQWQLGKRDVARQLLAETLPAVEEELQSPSSTWSHRATLEILRSEAEALIEPKEADEAVENERRTSDESKQ